MKLFSLIGVQFHSVSVSGAVFHSDTQNKTPRKMPLAQNKTPRQMPLARNKTPRKILETLCICTPIGKKCCLEQQGNMMLTQ